MMSNDQQLIPPPEMTPPSVRHLPLAKRIELWAELIDESEALVKASLRAKIGPEGDLHSAYRQWYAHRMQEHDKYQTALAENLTRRERGYGE